MRAANLMHGIERLFALSGVALMLFAIGSLAEGWVFQHNVDWIPPSVRGQTRSAGTGAVRILGRLQIPRLGVSTLIVEGVDDDSLLLGIGHVPGTALPGTAGNTALAAHRDTFFRSLRGLRVGDRIMIDANGRRTEYTIDSRHIVQPDDVSALAKSDTDRLTLITCYPFGFVGDAPNRLILSGQATHASAQS